MRRKTVVLIWLSRSNLRLVMITLTGVVIALSMLSGCLYYLDFSKQSLYLEILENEAPEYLDISSWSNYREDNRTLHMDITSLFAVFDQKISQKDLEQVIRPSFLYPRSLLQEQLIYQNQTFDTVISAYNGLDDSSILDECTENSQFPTNASEILVFSLENTTLSIGDQINLSLPYYSQGDPETYNFSLTISGIMINSSLASESAFRDLFLGKTFQFFTSLELFSDFVQDIDLALADGEVRGIDASIEYQYDIDLSTINRGTAVSTVNNYHAFLDDMKDLRTTTYFTFDRDLHTRLNAALMEYNAFFFQFLLISTPVLVLIGSLVFFSLGIINEKRQKAITLLKTKGVSNSFIFIILFVETSFIAFVAVVISALAGIPLAIMMGTSSGFLTFSRNISLDMVITPSTVQNLFVLGLAFTFLTHFTAIVRLSKSDIMLLEQEASKKKKRRTGILRSNIDVLLLTTGLGGIIIFNAVMNVIRSSGSPKGLLAIFLVFLTVLIVIAPFLFLLGSLIAFNRFIPLTLHYLGNIFWAKNSRLLATASRNLNSNAKITARTTLLIALSLSFIVIIASLPVSVSEYQVEREYYQWGADITSNFFGVQEESLEKILAALESIPGLQTTKVVLVQDSGYSWSANSEYISYFLGIEDDFAEVAYWKKKYNRLPLAELVSAVHSPEQNNSFIIDSVTASRNGIKLNEPYQLQLSGGYDDQESVFVQPVAFTNYFPGLIDRWFLLDRFYVGSYSSVLEMAENKSLTFFKQVWGRILPGYDPSVITEQFLTILENMGEYGGNFKSLPLILEQENNSLETSLLWLVANYNFLGALAVILAVVVLFGYARTAQNTRELALGRSLGLKYHQLFLLMISEPLLLFVLSGLPGAMLGVILLVVLIQFNAQNLFWGPPFVLEFDVPVILMTYGGILLLLIILGLVTAYKMTKSNISEILITE
ncbi:MAG: FtsX-like permease family protein [Candidatus Odinarchaeota archaeon]